MIDSFQLLQTPDPLECKVLEVMDGQHFNLLNPALKIFGLGIWLTGRVLD